MMRKSDLLTAMALSMGSHTVPDVAAPTDATRATQGYTTKPSTKGKLAFSTRYKINKVTDKKSNVQDGNIDKLAMARAKRMRKNAKHRKDYISCISQNSTLSQGLRSCSLLARILVTSA